MFQVVDKRDPNVLIAETETEHAALVARTLLASERRHAVTHLQVLYPEDYLVQVYGGRLVTAREAGLPIAD